MQGEQDSTGPQRSRKHGHPFPPPVAPRRVQTDLPKTVRSQKAVPHGRLPQRSSAGDTTEAPAATPGISCPDVPPRPRPPAPQRPRAMLRSGCGRLPPRSLRGCSSSCPAPRRHAASDRAASPSSPPLQCSPKPRMLPSSRKIRSYWRESSGGLKGW